ncbi:hypothetical protein GCM10010187_31770 [Actinomadura coerulea]|nr:hypothetical protein GCM10010187_31770 [Actinomadura coerulea]
MALVLTCCPPGPEEREKRQLSSDSGMETEPRTWIWAGMAPLSQGRLGPVASISPRLAPVSSPPSRRSGDVWLAGPTGDN